MFISKKKYEALEKRIADFEAQVQSQQGCGFKLVIDGKNLQSMVDRSRVSINKDEITLMVQ